MHFKETQLKIALFSYVTPISLVLAGKYYQSHGTSLDRLLAL